jgi:hypothetical protein
MNEVPDTDFLTFVESVNEMSMSASKIKKSKSGTYG